jgi:hypothetical protein
MELKELEKLTVVKLREMAAEYEDVKGASAMTKDQLLTLLCEKMGIDRHVHVEVARGVDKGALKKMVHQFKNQAAEARAGGDKAAARVFRRRAHHAKRKLRKSLVKVD